MRKLWEAAFNPPSRAEVAGGNQSQFAILPQNTEDELTISEVHSKLDRALNFLQRDVGYALLDDVRPHTGGGVRLQPPPRRAIDAVQKGQLTCKQPKEPVVRDSSQDARLIASEDLDGSIIKLLRNIFDQKKSLRASELAAEIQRRQASNERGGQLERLFRGIRIDDDREITWEEFEALHAQMKASQVSGPASASSTSPPKATLLDQVLSEPGFEELITISPEAARYAHYQCDLTLVSRFVQVLYKSILQDLSGDADKGLLKHSDAKKRCTQALCHDGLYKCVLQGVRLMHLCDYDYADVVLVLGYASVYFRSTFSSIGKKMSPNEAAHVVVLLIYLAHAFLLDETCPLRIWQKHIFRKYCTLKVLDAALFRLFQMRPSFKLRISDEEERVALMGLSGLAFKSSDEEHDQASDAIKQLMGANFAPTKLPSKETSNGFASKGASNGMSGGAVPGGAPAQAPPPHFTGGSSTGSNGRSPPGSGHSSGEVPSKTGVSRSQPSPPTVVGGRVGEASLLNRNQRRADRSSKEQAYAPADGLPLHSHPATAATLAK